MGLGVRVSVGVSVRTRFGVRARVGAGFSGRLQNLVVTSGYPTLNLTLVVTLTVPCPRRAHPRGLPTQRAPAVRVRVRGRATAMARVGFGFGFGFGLG